MFSSRGPDEILPKVYYEPEHLVVAREHNLVIPDRSETITIYTEAHTVIDT
jgi:hypothetical protein